MGPRANGWRCRYVPDAWTRLPSADWLLTGVTKASKGESGLDEWLTSVREALEIPTVTRWKSWISSRWTYTEDEVFVFTPKVICSNGQRATVLDFAFHIHSKLGSKCIGAKSERQECAAQAKAQQRWSGWNNDLQHPNAQTRLAEHRNHLKAKTKIRQALKEMASRQLGFAKETIERKFKNRKMDYDEAVMMRLIKRMGYKTVTEVLPKLAEGALEVNDILDRLRGTAEARQWLARRTGVPQRRGLQPANNLAGRNQWHRGRCIGHWPNLKGIDFKLAKCYSPIYGDGVRLCYRVRGIKYTTTIPNANQMTRTFRLPHREKHAGQASRKARNTHHPAHCGAWRHWYCD